MAQNENPENWQLWLLENIGQLTQYEMMNHQQKKVIADLSEKWAAEGIQMMVFKGQANAAFYPKPSRWYGLAPSSEADDKANQCRTSARIKHPILNVTHGEIYDCYEEHYRKEYIPYPKNYFHDIT